MKFNNEFHILHPANQIGEVSALQPSSLLSRHQRRLPLRILGCQLCIQAITTRLSLYHSPSSSVHQSIRYRSLPARLPWHFSAKLKILCSLTTLAERESSQLWQPNQPAALQGRLGSNQYNANDCFKVPSYWLHQNGPGKGKLTSLYLSKHTKDIVTTFVRASWRVINFIIIAR